MSDTSTHEQHQEEEWDASKHGGMSREELRAYADKLDLEVRQLPLEDVYDTIQQDTHILFYGAVFCPYTQQYTAVWLNMQYQFDFYNLNQTQHFSLAKVQCANNQPLCFHYMRDEGFPTIVLYHKGHYITEFQDRDNIWDFVQKTVEIVKQGKPEEEFERTDGSLVVPMKAHEMDVISHNKLEEEAIGGQEGIVATVFPIELLVLAVGVLMFAAFIMRRAFAARKNRGVYVPVQEPRM
ncbi:UNVERIFIED_CONTAM: hypothetical protein HDU68_011810 [Siphonaria sp. JEL0065]|nr:hypothetical protein HDU68_011810 [Siphonaria sp. JEL0065]